MHKRFEEVSEEIISNHKSKINEYRWKIIGKIIGERTLVISLAALGSYFLFRVMIFNDTAFDLSPDLGLPIFVILLLLFGCGLQYFWFVLVRDDKKQNEYLQYYKTNVIMPLLTDTNSKITVITFGMDTGPELMVEPYQGLYGDYFRSFDVGHVEKIDVLGFVKCQIERFVINIVDIYTYKEIERRVGGGRYRRKRKKFDGLFTSRRRKGKIDGAIIIRAEWLYSINRLGRITPEKFEKLFRIRRINKPKVKTDANADREFINRVITPEIIDAIADYVKMCNVKIDIAIQSNKLNIRFHFGKVLKPRLYLNPLSRRKMKDTRDKLEKVFTLNEKLFTLLDSQASQKNL